MHYALFAVLLVLAVFGFLFVILAVQALIGMSVLMRTRFAPSGGRTVAAQDELPEDERTLFDAAGAALARLGPCPIHRRSFAPLKAEQGELALA
mgnify:CR=1 FL=1